MATEYRLLTYRDGTGAPAAGVLVGDRVHAAATLIDGGGIDARSVLGLLQGWERARPLLAAAAQRVRPGDGKPLKDVTVLAPILYPAAVFCAGANYWDHAREMWEAQKRASGREPPPLVKAKNPWFFVKTGPHSIIGPDAPIHLPPLAKNVDWEAEAGVVIGRPARNVPVARAFDYVAGYVIVHDVSARDLGPQPDRAGTFFAQDWVSHKCFDDSCPMGPWITPHEFVPDPNDMAIRLWVNGVQKQNSNTKELIHGIAEQIAFLSSRLTLRPGDVIATGTPAGVGAGRGEFLKPGDEVRIEIGNLGTLVNRCAAA
jgi:2-keto-4-pentenoate hydratase/2-oxohepta-3-ene-1,7-dioic acid hydratase in catechol pathway